MSNTATRLTMKADDITNSNGVYKLLSFEDVKEVVKRALDGDVDLVEYSIRPYSEGKLGFLGSYYRLDATAARRKETIVLTFFVKTVPYAVPEQADYVIKRGVFEQEVRFYSVLTPLLLEGYRGEPWAPMCYKAKEDLIVFEELGGKGYSIRDKLFDQTLVRASLSVIARLHAASLLAEARLGMSFDRLFPGMFTEKAFICVGTPRVWFDKGVNLVAAIAERLGHDSSSVRLACERIYDGLKPSRTKANVISHGDLWGNNLMFNNDSPPKCLLVDYQLLRYSPLAHDVMQFLYLCTDRSFRGAWETVMLRHYYETLREILTVHKAPSAQIPSWSELIEGVEEQRLSSIITATMYFPTVLLEEDASARIMNDSATYAEYNFQNREKFVFSNMKINPIYERRINEAVIELAELASRLDQLPKPS